MALVLCDSLYAHYKAISVFNLKNGFASAYTNRLYLKYRFIHIFMLPVYVNLMICL